MKRNFNTVTHYCNWQLIRYLRRTHKNIRIIFDFKIIKAIAVFDIVLNSGYH
ncbi:hypothetical protein [Flavobacterium sp. GSP14]|uniref:hypothetical protein n=1 Tax=Flavobacterium sp. GSP14 TaxID=3401734 RepID=UPI003AAEBC75